MKEEELIQLAKEKKLTITKYWYNTRFQYGAKTNDMGEHEHLRIPAKLFDELIKLGCKFYN